jgi:hypothetical protein
MQLLDYVVVQRRKAGIEQTSSNVTIAAKWRDAIATREPRRVRALTME